MAEQRLRFLADAGVLLAGSLDMPATLRELATDLVPAFADWCTITVLGEDGALRRVAAAHHDPARAAAMARYARDVDPTPQGSSPARATLEAGQIVHRPHITSEMLDAFASDTRQRALLDELGCTSALIVPLIARSAPVGTLALVISDGQREFGELDIQLARELGVLIGLSIESARRLAAERAARERAERAEAESHRLLGERQQLLARAEAANRAKDEFLAMLGHELRNPLAPIITALELMRYRGGAPPRELAIIERQTRHLVRLVDDLLDVSRIARGKVQLVREPVEAADIVRQAVEMADQLFDQRGHRLTIDVPCDLVVDVDPARMAQVVANLLTNAAKYTKPGGTIAVTANRDDGDIVICVHDSGIGIAPDMLPHVFEMFVQERQGIDRSRGGLGLGLTIVKNLVEAHGGSVVARSEGLGKGAAFEIRLPASTAHARPAEAHVEVTPPDRYRVLVVDDNEDAAGLIGEQLERWGYETRVAHNAGEALEAVRDFTPQAAVLDIGLPGIDGYELARRLRAKRGFEDVTLIAVTGYGQDTDRDRALAAGFDHHLVKPVSIARIRSILDAAATDGIPAPA